LLKGDTSHTENPKGINEPCGTIEVISNTPKRPQYDGCDNFAGGGKEGEISRGGWK